jgi:hypothetical protein
MEIKAGDQFIFFGHGKMMHLLKSNELDSMLDKMTQRFTKMAKTIRKKVDDQLK